MAEPDSPRSFDEFYRAEFKKMVRVLMKQGARLCEAEDAVQAAMADAYRTWRTLRNPPAYVSQAARRFHIKDRKRESRLKQLAEQAAHQARFDGPTDSNAEREVVARIRELLSHLPPAQREVMALCLDGYKPKDIAAMLNKKENTVRTNLRQARQKLRTRLEIQPLDED